MPASALQLREVERVLAHPDTPAAYVEWREILPLLGQRDRDFINAQLDLSDLAATEPLGCARSRFHRMLLRPQPSALTRWMSSLAETPVVDFVDFHVPWLRNLQILQRADTTERWLDLYQAPHSTRSCVGLPDSLVIEITRSCNFACVMCSSRTDGVQLALTMPVKRFGEILPVLAPSAKSLRLNGYGETSKVPGLNGYLECVDQMSYRGRLELITNLSADLEVYTGLFDRGFILLVSWDAAEAPLFEFIRAGADYPRMLKTLNALGKHASNARERLGLLCTIQHANLHQILPLAELAVSSGAGLLIYNMVKEPDGSPWATEKAEILLSSFAEAAALCRRRGLEVRVPDHLGETRLDQPFANRSSATHCDRPWREILVNWDTELTACNMFNPFSYGVLCPPLGEGEVVARFVRLWNGPNASLFRSVVNSSRPHPYCQDCYYLYPSKARVPAG